MNIFRGRTALVALTASSVLGSVAVAAAPTAATPSTGAYIVVVNGDRAVDVVADYFASAGIGVVAQLKSAIDVVAADLTLRELDDIQNRPGVRWVEPNGKVNLATEQDIAPSRTAGNWGLDRVDQPTSIRDSKFRYASDGSGVDIYVFDTGIRRTHSEFTGRVAAGYVVPAAVAPGISTSTDDDCGHGTHVSGVAAGTTYGVAKRATVVPVKIFPGGSTSVCNNGTTVLAFLDGIDWVLRNRTVGRPAVANLSLGTASYSDSLDEAVGRLAAIMPIVAAAGNDGDLTTSSGYINGGVGYTSRSSKSPACSADRNGFQGILTVAASGGLLGPDDAPSFGEVDTEARYSNHGPCVDIFAPGTDIKSAWPVANVSDTDGDQRTTDDPDDFAGQYSDSGTYNKSGTSMAAPFVAGAIAMLLQQTPTATPAEVTSRILANATRNILTILPRVGGGTASPNLLLYTCASNCVPSAPKNVTVSRASRTEFNVTWETPESNGGLDVASYEAIASATGVPSVSCSATAPALTCKLAELTAGTSYSITVVAKNAAGTGASSSAKTLAAGAAPSVPGTPTVLAGNGEVKVTWTAPTDNGGLAISKYTVTSSPDAKTCSPVGAELACIVSGLTIGTKYTFSVSATNEAGSTASLSSPVIAPALPWEYVPVFVAVVPGNMKVDLQWTEARVLGTAPAGYFTGYVVKDATGAIVCATTELKCSVKKLKNAAKASYSVEATTIADSSQVAVSGDVIVGGLRQLANAMRKKTSAALVKIATTNSKGKVTWRALSGGCRISRGIVTAPANGKACKLRVSVAKSGAFPAQNLTVSVQLL